MPMAFMRGNTSLMSAIDVAAELLNSAPKISMGWLSISICARCPIGRSVIFADIPIIIIYINVNTHKTLFIKRYDI